MGVGKVPRGKFDKLETLVKKHELKQPKRWVHHSYVVQYILALGGPPAVNKFFHMMNSSAQSLEAFNEDWKTNYGKLEQAVAEDAGASSDDEDDGGAQASSSSSQEPGLAPGLTREEQDAIAASEDYKVYESVMKSLPEPLQQAILQGDLEAVRAALSDMDPEEAQSAVERCMEAGILGK